MWKFSPLTAKVTILSPYCGACQLANKSASLAARSLFVYFERSAACPKLQREMPSRALGVCVVGRFREVFWLRPPHFGRLRSDASAFLTHGEESARLTHCWCLFCTREKCRPRATINQTHPTTTLHQHTPFATWHANHSRSAQFELEVKGNARTHPYKSLNGMNLF
jgi:hypothetical protein